MTARWIGCLALASWSLVAGDGSGLAPAAHAGIPAEVLTQKLVIVTTWAEPAPEAALAEAYQQELMALMRDLGIQHRFSTLEEATSRSFAGRIVVLRMLENGTATEARVNLRELPRGALAWTHAAGDDVTPFGAVDLPSLRKFLRIPGSGVMRESALQEWGRAIARVAGHEIFHMLTRSKTHSTRGLMKPALTRAELLAEHAPRWTDGNRAEAGQRLPRIHPGGIAALSGQ